MSEEFDRLREDIAKIEQRVIAMKDSVENMRAQNSAEHGSLFSKLIHITDLMHWLKDKWIKFTKEP